MELDTIAQVEAPAVKALLFPAFHAGKGNDFAGAVVEPGQEVRDKVLATQAVDFRAATLAPGSNAGRLGLGDDDSRVPGADGSRGRLDGLGDGGGGGRRRRCG